MYCAIDKKYCSFLDLLKRLNAPYELFENHGCGAPFASEYEDDLKMYIETE